MSVKRGKRVLLGRNMISRSEHRKVSIHLFTSFCEELYIFVNPPVSVLGGVIQRTVLCSKPEWDLENHVSGTTFAEFVQTPVQPGFAAKIGSIPEANAASRAASLVHHI